MSDTNEHPQVRIARLWSGLYQAECECGWFGLPHTLSDHARVDTRDHTTHTRHMPRRPLVVTP